MTTDLREGLRELAEPVTRGVPFDQVAAGVRRSRTRRRSLSGGVALVVLAGGGWFALRPADTPARLAADGPVTVTLPDWVQRDLRASEIPDATEGTRLSTYDMDGTPLVTVGLRSQDRTCFTTYADLPERVTGTPPFGRRLSTGYGCFGAGGHPLPELGVGVSTRRDSDGTLIDVVLTGSAPHGTAVVEATAADGHHLEVDVYDAGADWWGKSWFAFPWVDQATTVRALDASGAELGCQRTREGEGPRGLSFVGC